MINKLEKKYMLKGLLYTVMYIIVYAGITLFTMSLVEYKIVYNIFMLLQILFIPIMFIGFLLMGLMHYLGLKFQFLSFLIGENEIIPTQYVSGSILNYAIIIVFLCVIGVMVGYLVGKKKAHDLKHKKKN